MCDGDRRPIALAIDTAEKREIGSHTEDRSTILEGRLRCVEVGSIHCRGITAPSNEVDSVDVDKP